MVFLISKGGIENPRVGVSNPPLGTVSQVTLLNSNGLLNEMMNEID